MAVCRCDAQTIPMALFIVNTDGNIIFDAQKKTRSLAGLAAIYDLAIVSLLGPF